MLATGGDYVGGVTQNQGQQQYPGQHQNPFSSFFSHFGGGMGGQGGQGGFGQPGGGTSNVGAGFDPYMHAGSQAIAQYLKSLGGMSDPTGYMAHLLSSYSQSPSAKLQTQQGIQSANAAAAASGMLGSGAEQSALQRQGQGIAQADQQRYLQNALGIQGQYLGGLGDISHIGEGAASGQAQAQAQAASLAEKQREFNQQQQFQEQQLKAQQHQSMWSNIAGGLGAGIGAVAHYTHLI